MGLSATRFLKHWPEMKAEYDTVSLKNLWMETFKHSGEQMLPPMYAAERLRAQGLDPATPPGTFQIRPLVYRMFVRQVDTLGVPVRFNTRVVDYEENAARGKGICIDDKGQRYEADLIIAADGVGSKSQRLVGGEVRARSSGRAMWRAAFPVEHLENNSEVNEFFKMVGSDRDEPIIRIFLGPGTYALALRRPETMIYVVNHNVSSFTGDRVLC